MDTDRSRAPAPPSGTPVWQTAAPDGVAAVDVALADGDWERVVSLRREGVTDAGLYRLLRLRTRYRRAAHPATDGLEQDGRALFGRWLVAQGRLHEGD
jgi:hypothetical protein